uniref:Transmembrane protein 207 n=1 Tax=Anas platyrhynchos platyrhynchos TaxID=8840 RepID=U3J1X2_ANAPP
MQRPRALCFTSWITEAGVLCFTFFQVTKPFTGILGNWRWEKDSAFIECNQHGFLFLMLFFLALLLSCGICCCLQCWLKRRSCLLHPRTLAVFALSTSEAPQCPFSRSPNPCVNMETSSPPAPRFSLGGTELPPSYEDIMKENKL